MDSESLRRNILRKNIATLEGIGELGKEFKRALKDTTIQSGCLYIEALINENSGEIVQFLEADPTRVYQQKLLNQSSIDITIGGILSKKNPQAKLIIMSYSVHTKKISSVTSNDFLDPKIMNLLQETISAFNIADFALAA